jgi:hypothetical protein
LTSSFKEILQRLNESSSVLDQKDLDKEHIFELLKMMNNNSMTVSELKAAKTLKFSNTYRVAYLRWFKEKGFLIDQIAPKKLSEKGIDALIELEDYLSPLETKLKVDWGLSSSEVEATLDGEIEGITKTAIFSKEYVRNRILELCACLSSSSSPVELNIRIPVASNELSGLLKLMWNFYWRKVTDKSAPTPLGPLIINIGLTDDTNKSRYTNFWKEHLRTYFQRKEIEGIGYTILPQGLEGLLKVFIEKEEVKRWIENQLGKDADWFMPHPIWVELGFKKRRENLAIEAIDHVSPPIFHEIKAPGLPSGYGDFDSILRDVVQKNNEKTIDILCIWLIQNPIWRYANFYKSWRILRKVHKEKIAEDPKLEHVNRILDQALCQYIGAGHNPNVDLQKVFSDYLRSKDVENIVNGIKNGKYSPNAL